MSCSMLAVSGKGAVAVAGGLAMQLARSYQESMNRGRCVLPVGYCQSGAGGAGAGGAGHARGAERSSQTMLATPTVMAACAASVAE